MLLKYNSEARKESEMTNKNEWRSCFQNEKHICRCCLIRFSNDDPSKIEAAVRTYTYIRTNSCRCRTHVYRPAARIVRVSL
jgi:hypothetical protein